MKLTAFFSEIYEFCEVLAKYVVEKLHLSFIKFEGRKTALAVLLYQRRGKHAKRLVHSGMAGIAALGVVIAPVVAEEFPGKSIDPWELASPPLTLGISADSVQTTTVVSEKVRDNVVEYEIQSGDTVSTIASKFDVSTDTILWQNGLSANESIKPGQILQILPVTGVSHKVKKGDTIYSIAKKYDVDAQQIVNYPFNAYSNDETFELAIGQNVIVPDGVIARTIQTSPRIQRTTPDAGTVVASGQFVWPAAGRITQNFVWYHPGLDIANKAAPNILAADSGKVMVAGWPDNYGYGNRVVIDHGNGYRTLYAHLSAIYVVPGQTVNRGDSIGRMGSTGRSTGIHLHFEVMRNGTNINPLSVLQ